MSERIFSNESFVAADWSEQHLNESEFHDCTFSGVSLARSDLLRCRFLNCRFVGCDLGLVRLTDSEISGGTFEDCRLVGIDWTRARWPAAELHGPNSFNRCDLSMGDPSGLSLVALSFRGGRACDVSFRGSNLSDADLTGTGADFTGSDLSGALLVNCAAIALDPRSCELTGAVVDPVTALQIIDALGISIEHVADID